MMPENNHNIIKPVEALQNIAPLTPAERREQRKRRRNPHGQNELSRREQLDRQADEQTLDKTAEDPHTIDYCA